MNPLQQLHEQGQSFWIDYIDRAMVTQGHLKKLIDEDGLRGLTSNPSIFEKAIASSADYDQALRDHLAKHPNDDAQTLFEAVAIQDIRAAADALKPVYESSDASDGFVSLEVSPHLSDDTQGTISEARRLWSEVDRPNLMIKVPATPEGFPAVETLIGEGINVNVTLIFSTEQYENAAMAYIGGLEKCADPSRAASVASFFVSRVDTKLDAALEKIGTPEALALRGKAAIANAKQAAAFYDRIVASDRFKALKDRGARPQRLLWGSTSTKNPDYPDTLYVDGLIGPDTVNTIPPATADAFRDHGKVQATLATGHDEAAAQLSNITALGVNIEEALRELLTEGLDAFVKAYDQLLDAVKTKVAAGSLAPS